LKAFIIKIPWEYVFLKNIIRNVAEKHENNVAMAAPFIPYNGIRIKFRIILISIDADVVIREILVKFSARR